jgi:hypothetical protein
MMFGWINLGVTKRGVLLFWAAWLSVVVLTNILDALKGLGVLSSTFAWTSGNFAWIQSTMKPLNVPIGIEAALFGGVIIWEALAAYLFWRAFVSYRNRPLVEEQVAILACAVNLALWCAFQVLDEVFLAYQPEGVHRVIFTNQVVTLLMLYLLPSDVKQSR